MLGFGAALTKRLEGKADGVNRGNQAPLSVRSQKKRYWKHVAIGFGILAVFVLLVHLCAGMIAKEVVDRLPPSVDGKVGKAAADSMRAQFAESGKTPDAKHSARVQRIYDELRGHLTAEEAKMMVSPNISVLVHDDVNAFAAPGGEVFVLSGLLDRVKEDDEQLRGVLAHELGHAVKRHGMRQLARSMVYGVFFSLVLGKLDDISGNLISSGSDLVRLSYSRDMEIEADAFSVELVKRAGYGCQGLRRFLVKMESHPIPEILSTHPDTEDRLEELGKICPASGSSSSPSTSATVK